MSGDRRALTALVAFFGGVGLMALFLGLLVGGVVFLVWWLVVGFIRGYGDRM